MTREQKYIEQLQALEIYDPAFDPEISTLCQLERELTRAKKEWSASAPEGEKPSVQSPIYKTIQGIRAEISAHRDSLGLTPKGLHRIKGSYYETIRAGEMAETTKAEEVTVLDMIRAKYAV